MTEPDNDLPVARLESYLSAERGVTVTVTEVLHDGLNLALGISTPDDGLTYVLRRPSRVRQADAFNDLKQEYRVLEKLEDTTIPAPEPVLFCDDNSVIGDPFFLFTHLDGSPVHVGSPLPERFQTEDARNRVADQMVDILCELHSVDPKPFEAVCDRKSPGDQLALATEQLDQATSVTEREVPALRSVGEWLGQNAPPDSTTSLVHGDFRPGNLLFTGTDQPEATGVLDWETAALGDPLTDLGYVLLLWQERGDPMPPLDGIQSRCSNDNAVRQVRALKVNGFHPFTSEPGSPSRRELLSRYGTDVERFLEYEQFYRAHAAFMLAAVWEDLHRHKMEAGVPSPFEPLAEYMALVAERIVEGRYTL